MMFRWLTIVLFSLVFQSMANANPIIGLFNPLVKAHNKFLTYQWDQAKVLLEKRLKTKDSLNALVYYDLSIIATKSNPKEAIQLAHQSILYFAKDSAYKNSKIGLLNKKRFKVNDGQLYRNHYNYLISDYYRKNRKTFPPKENSITESKKLVEGNTEIINFCKAEIHCFNGYDIAFKQSLESPLKQLSQCIDQLENSNDTARTVTSTIRENSEAILRGFKTVKEEKVGQQEIAVTIRWDRDSQNSANDIRRVMGK